MKGEGKEVWELGWDNKRLIVVFVLSAGCIMAIFEIQGRTLDQ